MDHDARSPACIAARLAGFARAAFTNGDPRLSTLGRPQLANRALYRHCQVLARRVGIHGTAQALGTDNCIRRCRLFLALHPHLVGWNGLLHATKVPAWHQLDDGVPQITLNNFGGEARRQAA